MRTVPRVAFAGSVALALLAGFIDAIDFVLSGGLFVSFMSGNSTQSGVEFITGAVLKGVVALTLVGGFLSGVVGVATEVARNPTLRVVPPLLGVWPLDRSLVRNSWERAGVSEQVCE